MPNDGTGNPGATAQIRVFALGCGHEFRSNIAPRNGDSLWCVRCGDFTTYRSSKGDVGTSTPQILTCKVCEKELPQGSHAQTRYHPECRPRRDYPKERARLASVRQANG